MIIKVKVTRIKNNNFSVTVEEKIYCVFKNTYKYESTHSICPGFWSWVKLPHRTLVKDSVSFQLDSWARDCKTTEIVL